MAYTRIDGLAEEEEEGPAEDFFEQEFDPVSLLDQMGQHEQGSNPAEQPYEVLIRAMDRDANLQPKVQPQHVIQRLIRLQRPSGSSCVSHVWTPVLTLLHGAAGEPCERKERRQEDPSRRCVWCNC